MTVSLTLSAVTGVTSIFSVGTSILPLFSFSVASVGFLPWASMTAHSAAFLAIGGIGLYTVMYCSPASMRWMPAASASWPVTGIVFGSMPADFIAAIAPPAVPSLAA